jgi:hypothetical protein
MDDVVHARPTLPSTLIKVSAGVVGLFGISGVLYGIGFLILRSHHSFLGIWGGVPWSSTEIAEEGGRFFYHLLFVPASLLSSLKLRTIGIVVVLAVAWDLRHHFGKRFHLPTMTKMRAKGANLRSLFPTLLLVVALIFTAIMLETVWVVSQLQDVVYSTDLISRLNEPSRRELYNQVLLRAVLGTLIAWYLYRSFWPSAGGIERGLIAAQWLLVLAAVALIPVAYGKLLLPTSYRTINYPNATYGETSVLIGQTSNSWIVWNSTKKQTEILPRSEKDKVVIGPEIDLLK